METSKPENAETPKRRNAETGEDGEPPALDGGNHPHAADAPTSANASPPPDSPEDRTAFWIAGQDLDLLTPPADVPAAPALKIAGPPPFPRGRFPVMGFLATVYEQVSGRAREMNTAGGPDGGPRQ